MERQTKHNAELGAARTPGTAVGLECIAGKIRPIRNEHVAKIDLRLSRLDYYSMLNLQPFLNGLECWARRRVIVELHKGLPSGTIELWSWMPGGGRAGIASHVIWKVGCLLHACMS